MRSSLSFALATVVSLALSLGAQAPDCRDAQACRQAALEAAARQDIRPVSRSGVESDEPRAEERPRGDGAAREGTEPERTPARRARDAEPPRGDERRDGRGDERRFPQRPGPAGVGGTRGKAGRAVTAGGSIAGAGSGCGRCLHPRPASDKPKTGAAEPPPERPRRSKDSRPAKTRQGAATPLTFPASALCTTVGLAYDSVSGRFIVGDGQDRRLMVLGERSGRLDSLAGVDAGFQEITAFEIDEQEGDLWVVSTLPESKTSTVHKLQLISGRVLFSVPLPDEARPGRFTDVTVTPQSVFVLDGEGRRVYRLAKKGKSLDLAIRLAAPEVASLAVAQEGVAYVAYDAGVLKIDLASRTTAVIESGEQGEPRGADLAPRDPRLARRDPDRRRRLSARPHSSRGEWPLGPQPRDRGRGAVGCRPDIRDARRQYAALPQPYRPAATMSRFERSCSSSACLPLTRQQKRNPVSTS